MFSATKTCAALIVPNCGVTKRAKGTGSMLRKLIGAGVIVVLLTGVAAAQLPMPGISLGGDNKRKLTPEELEAQKQRDKDYKAAMDKIPEKKVVKDPWGDIRPAPQSTAKNKQ
jgi:hypothetical protein